MARLLLEQASAVAVSGALNIWVSNLYLGLSTVTYASYPLQQVFLPLEVEAMGIMFQFFKCFVPFFTICENVKDKMVTINSIVI